MNCSVRADLPTPPLPTIITLCKAGKALVFFDIFAQLSENKPIEMQTYRQLVHFCIPSDGDNLPTVELKVNPIHDVVILTLQPYRIQR